MADKKREIGDPLDEVVSTGRIGGRQNFKSPTVRQFESPEVQQSNILDTQTAYRGAESKQFESPTVQPSKSPAVQTSKHSDTQNAREKRTQQTIYLPGELAKWLRIQAIQEEREISEIAAEALEMYKRLKA